MKGAELSSFHDGRFPIISIGMFFRAGIQFVSIFSRIRFLMFAVKSREISAPAMSQGTQLARFHNNLTNSLPGSTTT